MLIVFHKEMKVVNKEHQSILDLKLPFRNYDARIAFVCFEVPCCFEVHIPVIFFQWVAMMGGYGTFLS